MSELDNSKVIEENNLTTCRICGNIKSRKLVSKWGKDKKYVDSNGKSWNGLKCPDCHRKIQAEKQKTRRAKKKES